MKKIFATLLFLFCLVGCTEPVSNSRQTPDNVCDTYVYEIHTVGGVCDTVVTNSKPSKYVVDGCVRVIFDDVDTEYSFVDRFRFIEKK